MKDETREYFLGELHKAMGRLNFENWMIRDFLLEVLVWHLRSEMERKIFSPRKESAVGTRILGADATPEVLNILGRRILFVLGIYPEHLVKVRNRAVGLGYYIRMERTLANRLAHHYPIWKIVDRHFFETVKSLNYFRLGANIPRPKADLFYALEWHLKNCRSCL